MGAQESSVLTLNSNGGTPLGHKNVPDQEQAGQKDGGPWKSLSKLFSHHDNPDEGVAWWWSTHLACRRSYKFCPSIRKRNEQKQLQVGSYPADDGTVSVEI